MDVLRVKRWAQPEELVGPLLLLVSEAGSEAAPSPQKAVKKRVKKAAD